MTEETDRQLRDHLLQHFGRGDHQEDLCFALWSPSRGRTRLTALVNDVVLPQKGDRGLHGNASFNASFFDRVLSLALERDNGIAFLHSHPGSGWQSMSRDDVAAEEKLASRVFAVTGLPLVGLTVGIDGAWSARFWERIGRGKYKRKWCATARVIGEHLGVTFMTRLAPSPAFRSELQRTYSAWGDAKQSLLARLHVGIVGAGSVGSMVAEALARTGVEDLTLIDFDMVERHNLDRLLHATARDIGRSKVYVSAEQLAAHATAASPHIEAMPTSITSEEGYRAALDCDVLFSCVDRPWARNVMNHIAYAHLIPVIDGGVSVRLTHSKQLRGADWRAHVVGPGKPCLECLKQFDPADVSLERSGLLDDPSYIAQLPKEHFVHRNENVFGFAMNAAGLQVLQFLMMIVSPGGISNVGAQSYHFSTGSLDLDQRDRCYETCLYPTLISKGDHSGFTVTQQAPPSDLNNEGV